MLRDYQETAVVQLREAIKLYGSAVYVLSTGAGKTVVAGMIAQRVTAKGGQIMLVVHRKELVRQAIDTLQEVMPDLQVGVEAPGWTSIPWAPLQVGTIQSMVRRPHVASMRPTVVIFDEAHHARASTWEQVVAWWPKTPRIGLTATPERLDGKGLSTHFGSMIEGPPMYELVKEGWLAPCRTLTIPININLEGIKPNSAGEYKEGEMSGRLTDRVIADAADAYLRYAAGKKAIFFGENRDHSRRVVARLNEMGVRAAHVDGDDLPNYRDSVMRSFKGSALEVVGNCDLISEGFDAPACEVVILGKRTKSITRFLQQAGRAMRPGEGKTALILDLAGICHDLGLPDDPREWTLEDGEVSKRKGGEAVLRKCSECSTLHYGPRCNYCGHQAALPEEIEEASVELVEARSATAAPRKAKRSEVWKELAVAKRAPDPRVAVEEIARRRGYQFGWVGHILRAWGMT